MSEALTPGCKCSPGPATERCTKSGWVRCNERLAWLAKEARKYGLASWTAIDSKTNKPFPALTPTDPADG